MLSFRNAFKALVCAFACYGVYSLGVLLIRVLPKDSTDEYWAYEFQATHRWTAHDTLRLLAPLIKWQLDPDFPWDAEIEKLVLIESGMEYHPEGHLYIVGVSKPYRFILEDLEGETVDKNRNKVSLVLKNPYRKHLIAMR